MNKTEQNRRNESREEYIVTMAYKADVLSMGTFNGKENNYVTGAVLEAWGAGNNSAKIGLSKQGRADLLKSIEGGTKHGGLFSVIECKTQGADITAMYTAYLERRLKVDYVVYWLRKPYQKASEKKKGYAVIPLYPVIIPAEEFCEAVTLYALRKNKSNGKGTWAERTGQEVKPYTIEPNSPKWTAYLETRAVYSPLHSYTHTEIVSGKVTLNQEEEEYILKLLNLFE